MPLLPCIVITHTEDNKYSSNKTMSTPQKEVKMAEHEQEIRILKQKISRMKEKIKVFLVKAHDEDSQFDAEISEDTSNVVSELDTEV